MVPFVGGGDDDDDGGDVLGPELPPSILTAGGSGLPGPQRCYLHLQHCLHTQTDEPRMEPSSGA